MSDKTVLVYVGDHGATVPGVPACDLTDEMIRASGRTVDDLCAYRPVVYKKPDAAPIKDAAKAKG